MSKEQLPSHASGLVMYLHSAFAFWAGISWVYILLSS